MGRGKAQIFIVIIVGTGVLLNGMEHHPAAADVEARGPGSIFMMLLNQLR